MINLKDIRAAAERIRGVVHRTPLDFSNTFSRMTGARIHLKLESLQRGGSFKLRGAYNCIAQLSSRERAAGVVAVSAGNHAQGVALACKILGVPARIYMPQNTPLAKTQATQGYGAEVALAGESFHEASLALEKWRRKNGGVLVHPFDNDRIISGQGTIGLEILEDCPDLDMVVAPVGGGGLLSGIACAAKSLNPGIRIVGVQAEGANAATLSWKSRRLVQLEQVATLADGIAIKAPSPRTWRHLLNYVDDIVSVSDQQIAQAVLLFLERSRLVVEGAGAAVLAALISGRVRGKGKRIALIVSGGNIDSLMLSKLIQKSLVEQGRIVRFSLIISDAPGSLARLLEQIASYRASILDVTHDRMSSRVGLGSTGVEVTLETRGHPHIAEITRGLRAAGYQLSQSI
jgi:threonine dehydratase